ncbi:RICIN domain-containing protein [Kitasatospora sp. NPDC059146]|uniref:RICIN domain-containing protein n=1 Tax=unclassified Kitasatospora TaxID=2633591 RepID=UPI00367A1F8A
MIAQFSKGKRIGLVAAISALFMLAFTQPASAAGPKDAYLNKNSGYCLEIGGWRTDAGAPADQWPCGDAQTNQGWYFDQNNYPNGFWLKNKNSGMCLEVADWSTQAGAQIRQWPCGTNQANQQWVVGNTDGRWIELRNKNSGMCMEVGDWSKAWGAPVRQWPCGNMQANQMWGL